MTTRQTPDAVREAVIAAIMKADANFGYSYCLTKMDEAGEEHTLFMDGFEPAVFQDREDGYPVIEQRRNAARTDAILAALDSRAGDAFDMPEYAPDDISHLEGLASYLDGVAGDKGRAGLPASKSLFEEIAKRLREYDVIRSATPAPAVDAVPAGEVERLREALQWIADRQRETYLSPDQCIDALRWKATSTLAALSHGEGRK